MFDKSFYFILFYFFFLTWVHQLILYEHMFRKTNCDHGYKGISKDGIKILITVAYASAIIRLHTVQWVGDELFLSIINELLSNLSNVEDFSD